jgi:photosystem II stability/assembly factor-like uncharacterized protein
MTDVAQLNGFNALSRRSLLTGAAAAGLCACATPSAPQVQWVRQTTVPTTHKQDDIFFVNPSRGWYGNGPDGKLYGTANGGDTWELLWERPGTFIRALGFIDEQNGFLGNVGVDYFPHVTDTNPLYVTADGGRSWTPATNIEGPMPKGICAIDVFRDRFINHGVLGDRTIIRAGGRVGGPAFLVESHDNGATWRSRDLSAVTAMVLDVKFVSPMVGFLAGASDAEVATSNALVLKTEDGGETWRRVYQSQRPWEISWKLSFPTEHVGYVTVQNYNADTTIARRVVAKTEDGGRTWRELELINDHAFQEFGVGFVNARRGWVGGVSGGLETRDGGRHWRPVEMGRKINKIRVLPMPGGRFRAFAIGDSVYRLDDAE